MMADGRGARGASAFRVGLGAPGLTISSQSSWESPLPRASKEGLLSDGFVADLVLLSWQNGDVDRKISRVGVSRSAMALDELPSPSACARCPRTAPPLTRRLRVRHTCDVLSHARANARTALLVLLSFVHRRVDHSVQQPGGRRVDGATGRDAQRAPRRAEKALLLARSPAPRPAHCTKPN